MSIYKVIVERFADDRARLECGHIQHISRKPKAKTICATCTPAANDTYRTHGLRQMPKGAP